jgi:hypothetical protein
MNLSGRNLIILVCLIIGVGILTKVSKKDYATTAPGTSISDTGAATKNVTTTGSAQRKYQPSDFASPSATANNAQAGPEAVNALTLSQRVSKEATSGFMKQALLKMDLPDNMAFQKLDLPLENAEAIYSRTNGVEMTVVAQKGEVSQNDLENFLRSADTGLPNLDKRGVRFSAPKQMPTVAGSGMKSAQLWSGMGPGNVEVHVAVFARSDGKGSYMFVVSGNSSTMEARGDDFDRIYQSMKAESSP